MAGDEPRRHHVVPESLLARFTPAGTREDFLYVTDRLLGERWRTKPRGAAHQRDFYALEREGFDPYILEKHFAEIEGAAAGAINRTIADNAVPEGKDFDSLMHFISLLAVRTPAARTAFGRPMLGMLDIVLKQVLSEPDNRANFERIMLEAGNKPDENGKFGKFEELFKPGGITVELTQEWHMAALLNMQQIIIPLLSKRSWCVVKSDEGEFVCSNSPVSLTWIEAGMPAFATPGFGLPGTECTVPLDKNTVLCGSFEKMKPTVSLSRDDVAVVNTRIIAGARQVYSAGEQFLWINSKNEVQLGGLLEIDAARVKAEKEKAAGKDKQ